MGALAEQLDSCILNRIGLGILISSEFAFLLLSNLRIVCTILDCIGLFNTMLDVTCHNNNNNNNNNNSQRLQLE